MSLPKKEHFRWTDEAEGAFHALKIALATVLVLQLPDFANTFTVECDASETGFGAVLHQVGGLVAFFSRAIMARHAKLAAYEHELIGLVQVICHWRPYLWGRSFLICTDKYNLKFLLDQHLSKIPHHQWVSKLMDYGFVVEYKPSHLNTVADALSRRDGHEGGSVCALTTSRLALFDDLRAAAETNAVLVALRHEILSG